MGQLYIATFDAVAVTVVQDLFEINAPATQAVTLVELRLSQNSEAGDAQDEMLRVRIRRGLTTSGLAGTTATAVAPQAVLNGAAFGGTVEVNNTTQASGGSPETLLVDAWNVRAGYVYLPPTAEARPMIPGGGRMVIDLPTAPIDVITMSGFVLFEVG